MTDTVKGHPRKPIAVNVYSKRYYQEQLKADFYVEWNTVKDVVSSCGWLAMMKQFVCDLWNKETEEFHNTLQEEIDQEYKAQLQEWKKDEGTWQLGTAHKYYKAMQDSSSVLAPFADALTQRMGMYIAILMVGPLHDGEISVRR